MIEKKIKTNKDYLKFCETVLSTKVNVDIKTINACGASLMRLDPKGDLEIELCKESFEAVLEVYQELVQKVDENTVKLFEIFTLRKSDALELPTYSEWKEIEKQNKEGLIKN